MSTNYYRQGKYIPRHPEKYKGTIPVIYRSSPELQIFRWFDMKDFIIEWTSESVVIPYIKPIDNKIHRYFVDFSCVFKDKSGHLQKYLIEYKPYKQTIQPINSTRKKQSTFLREQIEYATNCSKWRSAKEYANSINAKFLIITEKDLAN
jgi:hypothetical protein